MERGEFMLAQTVRNNLKKGTNLRTKATKFSSLFQTVPVQSKEEESLEEVLAKANLTSYVKKEETPKEETKMTTETSTDEDFEYIVENPKEVIVPFPIVSDINLDEKLPFFKSITSKLNKIYG